MALPRWWWSTRQGPIAGNARDLVWFRVVVVAALAISITITWPLWNSRQLPPLLPAVSLPHVSIGAAILAASAASLILPRPGAVAVTLLIAYGMVTDQTRMQPEFFSLPILLWGSLPSAGAQLVARVHLISLWFYAGIHKVISPEFLTETKPRFVALIPISVPERLVVLLVFSVVALEIGTAVLAMFPGTRHVSAWSALILHIGILMALAAPGEPQNAAVWSWNVALACSGFALIAPWRANLFQSFMINGVPARATAIVLLVMPMGYYAGVVDAYPAHQLYSSGTANATIYCPAGCRPEQDVNATWFALNVPLPPQPRLFAASFQETCAGGDVLRIFDLYPPPWSDRGTLKSVYCRANLLPAAHP